MTIRSQFNNVDEDLDTLLKSDSYRKPKEKLKNLNKTRSAKSNLSYLKVLTAILIIIISALIAGWAVLTAGNKKPILVVAKTVQQGYQILPQDLTTAMVSASSNVSDISSSNESEVIGKYASTELIPGQMLASGEVTQNAPLASGSTVVGIPLKLGQEPINGLQVGDHVMIVFTPQPGSTPAITNSGIVPAGTSTSNSAGVQNISGLMNQISPGSVIDPDSTVVSESLPNPNTNSNFADEVSVNVPVNMGPIISLAASADQISLDLLPN